MKPTLLLISLLGLLSIKLATGSEIDPVLVEAESGILGSEFPSHTSGDVGYIEPSTDIDPARPSNPNSAARTAKYTVTFPAAGTWQLYVRLWVGSGTYGDDSFFHAANFGEANPTSNADWTAHNGLVDGGYTGAETRVEGTGFGGTEQWKWMHFQTKDFVVEDGDLIKTFYLGGREDGLRIDKFAFGQKGVVYTVDVLENGYPGPHELGVRRFSLEEGKVVFYGGRGPKYGTYEIFQSADLETWESAGLATFDKNGDFQFATETPAHAPEKQFYYLSLHSAVGLPYFAIPPSIQWARPGQQVSFVADTGGAEPISYQWYVRKEDIDTPIDGQTSQTLALANVQASDLGHYFLEATNELGTVRSLPAELSFDTPPNSIASQPDGYATMNGGTTGGGDATPATVSTAEQFKILATSDDPAVIIVNGRINLGGNVTIAANKTIIGATETSGLYGGTLFLHHRNYILQNLTLGPAQGDVVEISGATNVFITKCEFYDSSDELCSVVRGSDWVTISWSKFHFENPTPHSFAHLIGNGDGVTTDRGKLHVTLHHNWYTTGLRGRLPRVRYGHVHIYNNFYNAPGTGYCIGLGFEAHIRVEGCHFENVPNAWADYGGASNGEIGWSDLKFVNATQPTFVDNAFPVYDLPYSFALDPVDNVEALLKAGAGNVIEN